MILVDKNIKKLISENKLIVSGYKEENLKGIAYELTIDSIYNSEKNAVSSLDLKFSANFSVASFAFVSTFAIYSS